MNIVRPIVVTGANGRTGSVAARALLDIGEKVRVVLRNRDTSEEWIKRGAYVAIADLTDLEAMAVAFDDARAIYVVSPQEYGRQELFERAAFIADVVSEAASGARVPKIVALSSVGADLDHGTGWIMMNRMLEQRLLPLDVPIAFIRAAYFMENWSSLLGVALQTRTLPSFLSPVGRQIPMVAAADVGHVAASVLLEDWGGKRVIDLTGPRCYAPADVAQCLAEAIGAPIKVEAVPEADWPSALSNAGFSEHALQGFIELNRSLNSGRITFHDDGGSEARAGTTTLFSIISAMVGQGN